MLLDVGDSRRLRFLASGGIGSLVVGGAAMAFALETTPQTQQGPGAGTLSPASVATTYPRRALLEFDEALARRAHHAGQTVAEDQQRDEGDHDQLGHTHGGSGKEGKRQ